MGIGDIELKENIYRLTDKEIGRDLVMPSAHPFNELYISPKFPENRFKSIKEDI